MSEVINFTERTKELGKEQKTRDFAGEEGRNSKNGVRLVLWGDVERTKQGILARFGGLRLLPRDVNRRVGDCRTTLNIDVCFYFRCSSSF